MTSKSTNHSADSLTPHDLLCDLATPLDELPLSTDVRDRFGVEHQAIHVAEHPQTGRRCLKVWQPSGKTYRYPPFETDAETVRRIAQPLSLVEDEGAVPSAPQSPTTPVYEYEVEKQTILLRARREARERVEREEARGRGDDGDPYTTRSGLKSIPAQTWLLEDFLTTESVALMYGPSMAKKSFTALDLAACIATGRGSFHGKRVGRSGRVLYIAGEGLGSMDQRLTGWEQEHRIEVPDDALHFRKTMVDLSRASDAFDELLERAARERYDLLVVDTMRKAAGGSDENSPSERGALIDRMYDLSRACGGTVLGLSHPGWDKTRIRGASNQVGDVDCMIQVSEDGGKVYLRPEKVKDAELAGPLVLVPTQVVVGEDPTTGRPLTTLVMRDPSPVTADVRYVYRSSGPAEALWSFLRGVDGLSEHRSQADVLAAGSDAGLSRKETLTTLSTLVADGLVIEMKPERKGVAIKYRASGKPWPGLPSNSQETSA